MKVGDLVTLSSYGEKSQSLLRWNPRLYPTKPKLIGLIVKIEENPHLMSRTSKNDRTWYRINWINKECPASRYGNAAYYRKNDGYFLRNDLKFVTKG
jgi:hypothetical protein